MAPITLKTNKKYLGLRLNWQLKDLETRLPMHNNLKNEMVSLGDTAISLHILQVGGGAFCTSQNSKCQDLPRFEFSGSGVGCGGAVWCGGVAGGVLYQSKLKVPRSA